MISIRKSTIGDVCSRFSSGTSIKPEDVHENGRYPVYGGNGLRGYTDSYNFEGECAIIGRQGAYCGNVRYFKGKAFMTEHAIVVVPNEKNVAGYLALKFSLIDLKRYQGQSAQPGLSVKTLTEVDIDLPDKCTQEKVFAVINSIDSKIEVNNKIISELESMAKTIYDYWFLQFDFPDENGKPYKSSGGKMVWNEELKREIPEGWEVKELGELFETNRGVSYSSATLSDSGTPMINLATFTPKGGYNHNGLKFYSGEYNDDKVIHPYDLVMCNTQQTAIDFSKDIIGRVFLVPDIFDGDIVSSHHVNSIKVFDDNLKYYLCYLFNSDFFHKYISGYTNGTNILGLVFSGVEKYRCEIPPKKLLEKFANIVISAEKEKSKIIKENQELASLRDWLLPMLMNGQVTFKDEK